MKMTKIKERMDKEKWEITIDLMMVVGKYFKTSCDYVNVIRTCKRYNQLTQMYHFNPISDTGGSQNMSQKIIEHKNKNVKK